MEKMTIEISEALFHSAKEAAAREGTTLEAFALAREKAKNRRTTLDGVPRMARSLRRRTVTVRSPECDPAGG